tara:strand:+ start:502 stop:744 length:243 start_codon:yes stop_codon:yes gene_type:complete
MIYSPKWTQCLHYLTWVNRGKKRRQKFTLSKLKRLTFPAEDASSEPKEVKLTVSVDIYFSLGTLFKLIAGHASACVTLSL